MRLQRNQKAMSGINPDAGQVRQKAGEQSPLSAEALKLLSEVDAHLTSCSAGDSKISANNVKHALRKAKFDVTAASPELIASLDAVITKHQPNMDDTALTFSGTFSKAVVADQMEDAAFQSRFTAMQKVLAKNMRQFNEHYTEYREQKAERSYEAFREDLGEKKLDVSEWQSTMLFLMTGHHQNVSK